MKINNNGVLVYDKDGKLIGSYKRTKDAADAYGVKPSTIGYRINTGKPYDGVTFKRGKFTCVGKESVERQSTIPEDFEYPLLDYEEEHRICYTPCPHKNWVKIGSVLCQSCSSFKGMDRENHKLACNKRNL